MACRPLSVWTGRRKTWLCLKPARKKPEGGSDLFSKGKYTFDKKGACLDSSRVCCWDHLLRGKNEMKMSIAFRSRWGSCCFVWWSFLSSVNSSVAFVSCWRIEFGLFAKQNCRWQDRPEMMNSVTNRWAQLAVWPRMLWPISYFFFLESSLQWF